MSNDHESRNLIDEFRQLAGKSDNDLLDGYCDADREWISNFIHTELIGDLAPSLGSPEAFVQAVRNLDTSRREWSRHYGDVVIALHSNDLDMQRQAKEALLGVANDSPWLFLRRSAVARLG